MLLDRIVFYIFMVPFIIFFLNVTTVFRLLSGREYFPSYYTINGMVSSKPKNYDQIQAVRTNLCWLWFIASIGITAIGYYLLIPVIEADFARQAAEQLAK